MMFNLKHVFAWLAGTVLFIGAAGAQIVIHHETGGRYYSVANAHSHNDYQQPQPFSAAFSTGFGSMEADVFLVNDTLYVGHQKEDIQKHLTLSALYLDSVRKYVHDRHGYPYWDSTRSLQLLIDLKTEALPTLKSLVKLLGHYPDIIHSGKIKIVITGNRPAWQRWNGYPAYMHFDGNIGTAYPQKLWSRIEMMSGNLEDFVHWDGHSGLSPADLQTLHHLIHQCHQMRKKIRFWNAPDFPDAWNMLMTLGVDWINTDHIPELAMYMNRMQAGTN